MTWDVGSHDGEQIFELYRQSMVDMYAVENVTAQARRRFYNASTMALTRMGVIGQGRSSGQVMRRTKTYADRSSIDGINLLANVGPLAADCDGRNVRSRGGEVQIRDLSRGAASWVPRVDVCSLLIPRRFVPDILLGPSAHGAVLGRDTRMGDLIARHLRILCKDVSRLDEDQRQAGITAALAMTARALGDDRPLSPETRVALRLGLRWRAERWIDRHLLDPRLNADGLAKACGGSRATLYRAFEADGGVHSFVQKRRLERAHLALGDRQHRTVADIADLCGFASQPHFSRLFRSTFGYSPSDVRPRVRAPTAQAVKVGQIHHDLAIGWLKDLATAA